MDPLEQAAILQYTATGDKLANPAHVGLASLRPNLQDGLGFRGEVEAVIRLVIIDALHPIAIVEERCRSANAIRQQSLERPIQFGEKMSGIFFVQMDQILQAFSLDLVALLFEPSYRFIP